MIIGLNGYARSGKDTVGNALVEQFGFRRVAFADALRDAAYASRADLQPEIDSLGWDVVKLRQDVREYLQNLGVAVREHLDPDAWVKAAFKKIDRTTFSKDDRLVITDMRFSNEFKAVKDRGGYTVRLSRDGVEAVNPHISETALTAHEFDVYVENNGTPFETASKILIEIALKQQSSISKNFFPNIITTTN